MRVWGCVYFGASTHTDTHMPTYDHTSIRTYMPACMQACIHAHILRLHTSANTLSYQRLFPSTCPPVVICQFIYCIYLSVCLLIYLSGCLSVRPSVIMPFGPGRCLSLPLLNTTAILHVFHCALSGICPVVLHGVDLVVTLLSGLPSASCQEPPCEPCEGCLRRVYDAVHCPPSAGLWFCQDSDLFARLPLTGQPFLVQSCRVGQAAFPSSELQAFVKIYNPLMTIVW